MILFQKVNNRYQILSKADWETECENVSKYGILYVTTETLTQELELRFGDGISFVKDLAPVKGYNFALSGFAENSVMLNDVKNNAALGVNSIAAGTGTIANIDNQVVLGKFNQIDDSAIVVIGNGEDANSRHNAFTLSNDKISVFGIELTREHFECLHSMVDVSKEGY